MKFSNGDILLIANAVGEQYAIVEVVCDNADSLAMLGMVIDSEVETEKPGSVVAFTSGLVRSILERPEVI